MRTFFLTGGAMLAVIGGDFETSAHAQGRANLPPVTVEAPRARPAVRNVQRARRASPGPRRVVTAPVQRVAPVPFLTPSTGTIGAPPAPYAGGQVASGGQVGFLGNRGVMNTPFNQISYTAEQIQNQQAQTLREVVENNPSVRNVGSAGGGFDIYFVRGLYYENSDVALNGLYGLAPFYTTGANFVERVEILLGPNALLGGIPPAGTIAGSINLVTKKAPDFDITQVTGTYASRSQFGTLVDVARRYGEQKEFGIRFNGQYKNGGTAFDRQTEEFGNAVVGLDYRTERVRVSADIGYQAQNLNPPIRFVSFLPTVLPIPRAPDAGTNFMVPWATLQPRDTFAMVRGEVDVTDWATLYAAAGAHRSDIDFVYPSPTVINTAGDYVSRPFKGSSRFDTKDGEIGVRAKFNTGPVNHAVSVNFSSVERSNDFNAFAAPLPLIASNIYNPRFVPEPTFPLRVQQIGTNISLQSVGIADTMSVWGDRVQLTAGVRRQRVGQEQNSQVPAAISSSETYAWSPAVALVVKPVAPLSLYANYIEGLQAGATVGIGFANAGTVFAPYKSKQGEVGAKIDLGRITTTFSLFEIKQPSVISIAGTPPIQQLAGEQRNRGAEFNVFGEVAPYLRLLGGVAFIDGRLTRTQGGLSDGNKAPGVPSVQVSMGAEWDPWFTPGLTFSGRVLHASEQFVNAANTQQLPNWTRLDLGARYTFLSPWNGKPIVLRANMLNVFDKGYWQSAYNGVVTVGTPRTFLLSTTFNF